jgi:hypothetical protein
MDAGGYDYITIVEAFRLSHPKHGKVEDCDMCLQVEEWLAENPQESDLCDLTSRCTSEDTSEEE